MEGARLVSVENKIVQLLPNALCQEDALIQLRLIWNLRILLRIVHMVAKQILNVLGIPMTQQ